MKRAGGEKKLNFWEAAEFSSASGRSPTWRIIQKFEPHKLSKIAVKIFSLLFTGPKMVKLNCWAISNGPRWMAGSFPDEQEKLAFYPGQVQTPHSSHYKWIEQASSCFIIILAVLFCKTFEGTSWGHQWVNIHHVCASREGHVRLRFKLRFKPFRTSGAKCVFMFMIWWNNVAFKMFLQLALTVI